jgi:hypothetical protein
LTASTPIPRLARASLLPDRLPVKMSNPNQSLSPNDVGYYSSANVNGEAATTDSVYDTDSAIGDTESSRSAVFCLFFFPFKEGDVPAFSQGRGHRRPSMSCHGPQLKTSTWNPFLIVSLLTVRTSLTESLTPSIMDYRFENGRRYHAYKDGCESQQFTLWSVNLGQTYTSVSY